MKDTILTTENLHEEDVDENTKIAAIELFQA